VDSWTFSWTFPWTLRRQRVAQFVVSKNNTITANRTGSNGTTAYRYANTCTGHCQTNPSVLSNAARWIVGDADDAQHQNPPRRLHHLPFRVSHRFSFRSSRCSSTVIDIALKQYRIFWNMHPGVYATRDNQSSGIYCTNATTDEETSFEAAHSSPIVEAAGDCQDRRLSTSVN
jgi:hypothetical protein